MFFYTYHFNSFSGHVSALELIINHVGCMEAHTYTVTQVKCVCLCAVVSFNIFSLLKDSAWHQQAEYHQFFRLWGNALVLNRKCLHVSVCGANVSHRVQCVWLTGCHWGVQHTALFIITVSWSQFGLFPVAVEDKCVQYILYLCSTLNIMFTVGQDVFFY